MNGMNDPQCLGHFFRSYPNCELEWFPIGFVVLLASLVIVPIIVGIDHYFASKKHTLVAIGKLARLERMGSLEETMHVAPATGISSDGKVMTGMTTQRGVTTRRETCAHFEDGRSYTLDGWIDNPWGVNATIEVWCDGNGRRWLERAQ